MKPSILLGHRLVSLQDSLIKEIEEGKLTFKEGIKQYGDTASYEIAKTVYAMGAAKIAEAISDKVKKKRQPTKGAFGKSKFNVKF